MIAADKGRGGPRVRIGAFVGALAGLAVLVALVVRSDVAAIGRTWNLAGWPLLWLVPYRMVYFLLFAVGWLWMLRPYDRERRVGFGYVFWVTTVREAIDRLLPVASVGGGVAGVRLMAWRGLDAPAVSATVVAEIIVFMIVSYVFTALGLLALADGGGAAADKRLIIGLVLSVPIPVITVLLLRYGSVFARMERLLGPLVGIQAMSASAAALDLELRAVFERLRTLLLAGSLQLVALLSGTFESWLALRLFGHPVSLTAALTLESMNHAVRHLAFMIPAGVGFQEAGLVFFGHTLGIGADLALCLSMAKRLREILCGVPALVSWQWLEARRIRAPAGAACACLLTIMASADGARAAEDAAPASTSALGSSWFNLDRLPFIPVPSIGVDPDSGTTLGILPVWLHTDDSHAIRRIIAPDLLHNPDFGVGGHMRVFAYPSTDEQWSIVTGAMQHVQRLFDADYQWGRLREKRWTFLAKLTYERNGARRFYGIGNETLKSAATNFTDSKRFAQVQAGFNLTRAWQLLYTLRSLNHDILSGTLPGIPSIESRFAADARAGAASLQLNRLSLTFDTRDDQSAPRHGVKLVAYSGLASRGGLFNDSMYSEAGIDGRGFWPVTAQSVLATHIAVRYLPTVNRIPFWALSSIGGNISEVASDQPLRGYGTGRFVDRNSFSTGVEYRHTAMTFDAAGTHVEIEMAPFADVGRVFAQTSTLPLTALHKVGGIGFRAIARPSVVGYVDIGYGSEGVAAFTGIDYPF